MQRAYAKVSKEMPDVKSVSVTPSSSSFLSKFFMPRGANAVTNPFTGNISYNPEMIGNQGYNQNDIEDILAHEMTHVRQTQDVPWYKMLGQIFSPKPQVPAGIPEGSPTNASYYWQPHELEAYQTERNRMMAQHRPNPVDPIYGTRDIVLPPQKVINKVGGR
jgi:hypothetical protein